MDVVLDFIGNKKINSDEEIKINLIINYCQKDIYRDIRKRLFNKNLDNIVKIVRSISHMRVINYLNSSDVLLLICNKKGHEDALPGKLPEYVGAKKNILAISNDYLVKEVIVNDKLGWVCDHEDHDSLMSILDEIYLKWKGRALKFEGNFKKYDVKEKFKKLNPFLL